ncbi:MAG: hypothetical protein ACREA9_21100 [Pyrinomonadaceae bacterium]
MISSMNLVRKLSLKLAIAATRLLANAIGAVGYRVWDSGDQYSAVGNAIVRCATRLRIRAYEWERRIK